MNLVFLLRIADTMNVQINKSGGYDQPSHIYIFTPYQRIFRNRDDAILPDTDIPYRIQICFGIDHPAAR